MNKNVKKIILMLNPPLFRVTITSLLESAKGIRITASVGSSAELMKLDELAEADLILVDLESLGRTMLPTLEKLMDKKRNSLVLLYSDVFNPRILKDCLGLGVQGYILKTDPTEILISAVENVLSGKMALSPAISPSLNETIKLLDYKMILKNLTPREMDVMYLVAEGLSSRLISERLKINRRTVDKHRENVKGKLYGKSIQEVIFVIKHYNLQLEVDP